MRFCVEGLLVVVHKDMLLGSLVSATCLHSCHQNNTYLFEIAFIGLFKFLFGERGRAKGEWGNGKGVST